MPKVVIDISDEELESFRNLEIRSYHPVIFTAVKNGVRLSDDLEEAKTMLTNVSVCPHCNSQNISTMYDPRRMVYRVMCGECRRYTDYDRDLNRINAPEHTN